jgi:ATP-dependent RNA helicase RhlE
VLVVQIVEEVKKLTKYSNLRSAGIYGDTNINTQKQLVYDGLDILVATPGRLIDLTFTGVLRLKSIKKLVIDEVDEMLSLGLRPQLASVLELLPEKRQNLMFSATITPDVEDFLTSTIVAPQRIVVNPHGTPIEQIGQSAYIVPNFNTKVNLLELLLKENADLSKVLIFVKSKKVADHLFEQLDGKFPEQISVIHSNKAHNTRLTALKQFEDGTHRMLIATDIVARGMDITDVTHVVNFDMPEVPSDYLHRIGRTGRAHKDGEAISFIGETEQEYQFAIEQMMGRHIVVYPLPENLEVSKILIEEEKPVNLGDKDYLLKSFKKSPKPKASTHEKKVKNRKVNLGGPKNRKEKYEKLQRERNPNKPKKTRF